MIKNIALIGENSKGFVRTLLKLWNKNNCVALIDWRIPFKTIINTLLEYKINVCYIEKSLLENNIQFINDTKITFKVFEGEGKEICLLNKKIKNLYHPNYSNNNAVIIFSSGTTGKSKGIILSHYAITTNADLIASYMIESKKEKIIIVKSLSHSSSFVGELLVGLKGNIDIFISPSLMFPQKVIKYIIEQKIDIICLNPQLLELYLKIFPKNINLKKIYVSGSFLPNKLLSEARSYLKNTKIYNAYGLTECGPRVCSQTNKYKTIGSVGVPLKDIKIKIKNQKVWKDGKIIGEIWINTPCKFSQYLGLKKNKSAWINSKDLGYFNNNELFVIGRKDDMISSSSHNVYPSSIEEIILELNYVDDCIVFGKKDKNNEIIVCLYVSNDNLEHNNQIIKHCKENLAPYEIPKEVILVNEIKKNNNGKKSIKLNKDFYLNKYERKEEL